MQVLDKPGGAVVPNLWCIGDANGKMMLAHAASAQGISAIENICGRSHAVDHGISVCVCVCVCVCVFDYDVLSCLCVISLFDLKCLLQTSLWWVSLWFIFKSLFCISAKYPMTTLCSVLQWDVVCCSVLRSIVVNIPWALCVWCCGVLQCAAQCSSEYSISTMFVVPLQWCVWPLTRWSFSAKEPYNSGSFAENDPQLEVTYAFSPPFVCLCVCIVCACLVRLEYLRPFAP